MIGTWAEIKNGHNIQLVTDALVVRLFGVELSEYIGLRVKIIPLNYRRACPQMSHTQGNGRAVLLMASVPWREHSGMAGLVISVKQDTKQALAMYM